MFQMSKDTLLQYNEENISTLLAKVQPILEHRIKLYKRYARKISPYDLMQGTEERSCVPFEFYIVNMAQGYLAGKAPTYNIMRRDKDASYTQALTDEIVRIRAYNDDASTFMELMHDYLITTAAYLYAYENDDNQIVYTPFDARQTVGVFDYETPCNLIGVVRAWIERGVNEEIIHVIEVITEETRITYREGNGAYHAEKVETHHWSDVPCVAFEEEDGIAVFEPAIAVIDAYEQAEKNIRSMTQYNDEAKLLISGYASENSVTIVDEKGNTVPNPARKAEETAWMKALTLFIGEGGDVKWLLKSIDYSGLLEVQKSRHDKITMLTGVPNMTDEAFASADNASALGYKLYALDQYSATTDRVFKKGFLRLWELICGRINLKSNTNFDFRDIVITMQRNIPTDKDKSIDRAVKMKNSGLFSSETCINESTVEVDAAEELEKVAAEEQADYDRTLERAKDLPENAQTNEDEA